MVSGRVLRISSCEIPREVMRIGRVERTHPAGSQDILNKSRAVSSVEVVDAVICISLVYNQLHGLVRLGSRRNDNNLRHNSGMLCLIIAHIPRTSQPVMRHALCSVG
jgi:hypothetical protein